MITIPPCVYNILQYGIFDTFNTEFIMDCETLEIPVLVCWYDRGRGLMKYGIPAPRTPDERVARELLWEKWYKWTEYGFNMFKEELQQQWEKDHGIRCNSNR